MGEIYCLYVTGEGLPRYVGQTEGYSDRRFKKHVTAALEKREGLLYDWMREAWRGGKEIEYFVLQTDIIPADLDLYEKYWMAQFTGLLNTQGNKEAPVAHTDIGRRVMDAIQRFHT